MSRGVDAKWCIYREMYNKLSFLLLKPQEPNTSCYNSCKKKGATRKSATSFYLTVSGEEILDALDGLPLPLLGDSGVKRQRR